MNLNEIYVLNVLENVFENLNKIDFDKILKIKESGTVLKNRDLNNDII